MGYAIKIVWKCHSITFRAVWGVTDESWLPLYIQFLYKGIAHNQLNYLYSLIVVFCLEVRPDTVSDDDKPPSNPQLLPGGADLMPLALRSTTTKYRYIR